MIVDHLSDTNYKGLHSIAKSCEMPEFVKEANVSTQSDVAGLPLECFADPRNRSFPINTKEDAWFSCAYFEKFASGNNYSEHKYANIKEKLQKAAQIWGFEWPTFMQEKEASAPIEIVYVTNGQPYHTTGVYDFAGLEKLANDLIDNRGRYPWDMRRDTAKQLLASEHLFEGNFGNDSVRTLQKIAGQAVGLLKEAQEQLMSRRQTYHRHPEVQEKLASFANSLEEGSKNGFISPETANNVVGLLDVLDRMSEDNNKYASHMQAPEDIIFSVTLRDMQMINNHMVKLANGAAISTFQAGSQKTAHFLKTVTGVEVNSPAEAIEAVQKLDARTAGILTQAV
jgi:hypothetical protein